MKKEPLSLLAQMISASRQLNRDEKLALVKYLMLELDERVYTIEDVNLMIAQQIQAQHETEEMLRVMRQFRQ